MIAAVQRSVGCIPLHAAEGSEGNCDDSVSTKIEPRFTYVRLGGKK